MPPRTVVFRLAAALAVTTVASAQTPGPPAGDVPITSAVFRVERRAVPGLVLHVENLRDAPLQTWMVNVGTSWRTSDYGGGGSFPRGDGPIASREVRAIGLQPSSSPIAAEPVVKLAVFEDGWVEGEKEHIDAWTRVRQRRVEDASHWIAVLDQARGQSDEDAKAILRSAVLRRRIELTDRPTSQLRGPLDSFGDTSTTSNIGSLVNETTPRPAGWLAATLTLHRDRLVNERRAMLRPLFQAPRTSGGTDAGRVGSVAVRVVNEPVTSVFATIQNLRDVPIEAYEFNLYDSPTQLGPSSGQGSDSVGVDGPGDRIQPREVRSISVGERAVTPTGRLAYVLYDDLVFEGSIERRNELFKGRERQAEEYAYRISALTEAKSKAPADVREFFTLKRRDWIQSNKAERLSIAEIVQQIARVAESQPELLVQALDDRRARMERMRQALTRHLKR